MKHNMTDISTDTAQRAKRAITRHRQRRCGASCLVSDQIEIPIYGVSCIPVWLEPKDGSPDSSHTDQWQMEIKVEVLREKMDQIYQSLGQ